MPGDDSQIPAAQEPVTAHETFRLDRTAFSVVPLGDEPSDRQYWWNQTPLQRLEALEFVRQVAFGYDPFTARLQRS